MRHKSHPELWYYSILQVYEKHIHFFVPSDSRPTSLAWEVRKMSPGRHVLPSPSSDRMVPSPSARRALNFG